MWARKSSRAGGGPSKTSTAPTCMCDSCSSRCRNDASTELNRSLCVVAMGVTITARMGACAQVLSAPALLRPTPPHLDAIEATRVGIEEEGEPRRWVGIGQSLLREPLRERFQ